MNKISDFKHNKYKIIYIPKMYYTALFMYKLFILYLVNYYCRITQVWSIVQKWPLWETEISMTSKFQICTRKWWVEINIWNKKFSLETPNRFHIHFTFAKITCLKNVWHNVNHIETFYFLKTIRYISSR